MCVVVENVPHHLFFLPARSSQQTRVEMGEVKKEVMEILSKIVNSPQSIRFRVDRKKYAFEIEGIPPEVGLLVSLNDRKTIFTLFTLVVTLLSHEKVESRLSTCLARLLRRDGSVF